MTLPPLFAVARGSRDLYLFEARRLHDDPRYWAGGGPDAHETFEISPHFLNGDMPGFVAPDPEGQRAGRGGRVNVRIVDDRFRGGRRHHDEWRYINHYIDLIPREEVVTWHTTGFAVFTMLRPHPIPLIEMEVDLPCTDRNRIHFVRGSPRDVRAWWEHWNPARLIAMIGTESDSEDEEERRRRRERRRAARAAAAAAAAPATPALAAPGPRMQGTPSPPPIPKFVAEALVRDAVSNAAACPITMEPLKTDTTAVTACFHLFERDAIAAWMIQSGGCCAVCKQRTAVTV